MYGEKAWQQLHKTAVNNINQVLEAAPYKAAAVRPLTTHHKLSKSDEPDIWDTAGEVGTNRMSDILLWTPAHGRTKAGQPARIYIQLLCADTGCSLEGLPGAMDDREGWQKRVREIRAGGATW